MVLVVKHAFTNPKADGPDPTVVKPSHWNADHVVTGEWSVPGMIIDFAGAVIPPGFLECYGQSVSAAAYPLLFAAMVKQAPVTLTLGSPGIVNWAGHGLKVYSQVMFKTTGGLPTGLNAGDTYLIGDDGGYGANSFRVMDDEDWDEVNFTGGQSGTHTAIHAPFGVSFDLTTFSIPDLRGRVLAGYEMMGATDENWSERVGSDGVDGRLLASEGGDDHHTLTVNELPAHTHGTQLGPKAVGGVGPAYDTTTRGALLNTNSTGSGNVHNNMQPTIITRKLIYTG